MMMSQVIPVDHNFDDNIRYNNNTNQVMETLQTKEHEYTVKVSIIVILHSLFPSLYFVFHYNPYTFLFHSFVFQSTTNLQHTLLYFSNLHSIFITTNFDWKYIFCSGSSFDEFFS